MSKVLIVGASGFLGTKLYDIYASRGKVAGTYNNHPRGGLIRLDITDSAQTHRLIASFEPEIVIHTVALSDPDICEQRKSAAERINHVGTKNIVAACREVGARLDYMSTVYVFDGKKGNYTEEDKPHPINWYGETKLRAEQEVATLPNYGIYRFDKLYGYNGEGKPNDALSKLIIGEPFEVNSDQLRQPLFLDDVARALHLAQEQSLSGIFHLGGPDRMTKYELTLKLARLLGKESLVNPISETEQLARRPKDVSVVATKMESLGMTFTPLAEALTMIEEALRADGIEGAKKRVESL